MGYRAILAISFLVSICSYHLTPTQQKAGAPRTRALTHHGRLAGAARRLLTAGAAGWF